MRATHARDLARFEKERKALYWITVVTNYTLPLPNTAFPVLFLFIL